MSNHRSGKKSQPWKSTILPPSVSISSIMSKTCISNLFQLPCNLNDDTCVIKPHIKQNCWDYIWYIISSKITWNLKWGSSGFTSTNLKLIYKFGCCMSKTWNTWFEDNLKLKYEGALGPPVQIWHWFTYLIAAWAKLVPRLYWIRNEKSYLILVQDGAF